MRFRSATALVLFVGAATLLLAGSTATAYPEPSLIGRAWQLSFRYTKPRVITIRGLDNRQRWYWYMSYIVINNSNAEQFFVPEVTVATDRGDVITAGSGVLGGAFSAIKKEIGDPLLENPAQVSGRILIGKDHAKASVVIWPAFSKDIDQMTLFVAGLSGEKQAISHPLTGEEIVLRKSLMLSFDTPGTPHSPQQHQVKLRSKQWVMR